MLKRSTVVGQLLMNELGAEKVCGKLSKLSGLSTAAISSIERGKSSSVRPLSAQKICDGLGVEFDALFELVDSENSPKDER